MDDLQPIIDDLVKLMAKQELDIASGDEWVIEGVKIFMPKDDNEKEPCLACTKMSGKDRHALYIQQSHQYIHIDCLMARLLRHMIKRGNKHG